MSEWISVDETTPDYILGKKIRKIFEDNRTNPEDALCAMFDTIAGVYRMRGSYEAFCADLDCLKVIYKPMWPDK